MSLHPYLIKARLKSKELARKFRRPLRADSPETFFSRHWKGAAPDNEYFADSTRFFFGPNDMGIYGKALSVHFADSCREAMARADKSLEHKFDILGSGEKYLGEKINWHCDFISGRVWERQSCSKVRLVYQNDNSDVKIPWELSRLQFLTDLGRAYFLAENKAYKDELIAILCDWEKENPVDIGVNWACSMEVAIRAINIIWGMNFFAFTDDEREFVRMVIRLLYYHALHIERNLEIIAAGANSNHLLSDYLGLFYIGLLFPEFDRATKWVRIGTSGLESEISRQVTPDGPDYEGSTSYHRLVLEIFLSAYILAKRNNVIFSNNYNERLLNMIRFSEAAIGNSGHAPLIGDNDDGYIVKLASEDPSDHSPLIDVGLTFLKEDFSIKVSPAEERAWYLGVESLAHLAAVRKTGSRLFGESGYAIIKNDRLHIIFNAYAVPKGNFGGHKHNDILSFTLEIDGLPYFIDPGTCCYTSDFAMRNLSRSTALHNVVEVDSQEQNRYLPERLFYLMRDAEAKIDLWAETAESIMVSGIHTGYKRLDGAIIHRRTITAFTKETSIVITDEFSGKRGREHDFTSRLITPHLNIETTQDRNILIKRDSHPGLTIKNSIQGFLKTDINPIEYFPRYGVRTPGFQIEFRYRGNLPFVSTIAITPGMLSRKKASGKLEMAAK